ncbi:protein mono-ADP-ribosyltransferase TIPARP [Archocentrus centrarchus]|uniref:protein mono-ADP-ribosyltransferase TIPARP n=1 Tax=Archocentrus centrarchus TaxID=63155 RepID=UPI0011E9FC4D|nr:protein mono-ADP-ribosyltransferase TIPARP [Archocentrus centrarchus]
MAGISCSKGVKRKLSASVKAAEPEARSSRDIFMSPSHLLFQIPANINTSLPVWEAMRAEQAEITWTMNPYSLSLNITPLTSRQGKCTTPSKSESSSSMVQTTLASSILQLQLVIQPINQQPSTSQNYSSTMLKSPQNTQSASCPPNLSPNPATSLFVSLPIVITQGQPAHQLSTPIQEEPIDPTQSPTQICTKQATQIPSKVPLAFHTKSCSTIRICEDFLLGLCAAGQKCKMHHTPYPFHWQLWCVATHQWVDLSPSSQVLLERLYCDVNQDTVCLKNGNARYTLNFDLMELDDSSVYDGVRRLSNTYSQVRNPYFASILKIYWRDISWEEYNPSTSAALLQKITEKESECFFSIGSQMYKVDFIAMIQMNMTTGFRRRIRCRPVYRSLDSMKPYLQTQILPVSMEPNCYPPGANFSVDPLAEFSSWYPPVWCQASGQDYGLVDVPAGTLAYQRIQELFYGTLPETKVDIIGIQQIQNLFHWDKYQRHKVYMQKQHGKSLEGLERHLFHGTTKEASEDICANNFDPRVAGVNGVSLGFGTYFATSASVSNMFSPKFGQHEVRHMFLAKVLVGKFTVGRSNYHRPPQLIPKTKQRQLYDTCVDNVNAPSIFAVYDACQCYPYYLIKYKDLPKEIDI